VSGICKRLQRLTPNLGGRGGRRLKKAKKMKTNDTQMLIKLLSEMALCYVEIERDKKNCAYESMGFKLAMRRLENEAAKSALYVLNESRNNHTIIQRIKRVLFPHKINK